MMIAKTPDSGSEQARLSFKNIFPILKFSLTGSRTLAAIRFRGNDGEPVAGDFRLDISGDAYMEADFSESTVEEVSLTCGVRLSATPQTFYLVVPPRTYAKGYTIDFVADDGSVMTQVVSKDTPKTLLRSKIYEYPTPCLHPAVDCRSRLRLAVAGRNGGGVERRLRRTSRRRRPGCGSQLFHRQRPRQLQIQDRQRVTARLSTVSTAMSISRQAPPRATP